MEFAVLFPENNGNFSKKFPPQTPKILAYAKKFKPALFAYLPEVDNGKYSPAPNIVPMDFGLRVSP